MSSGRARRDDRGGGGGGGREGRDRERGNAEIRSRSANGGGYRYVEDSFQIIIRFIFLLVYFSWTLNNLKKSVVSLKLKY